MGVVRIIGVDPGYAIVGWGVVDYNGSGFKTVDYGAITTEAGVPFAERLEQIYNGAAALMDRFRPQGMGIEKLYFTKNVTTGIDVAQARGVVLLAARQRGLSIGEYSPPQVKQSVTGYGGAEKSQMMQMTKMLLGLPGIPKPDDVADALAVAICHAHTASSLLGGAALAR